MHSIVPQRQRIIIGMGICLCMLVTACSTTTENRNHSAQNDVKPDPLAKNVVLFIGDGMGVSTVTAIRILDGQQKGMSGEENVLPFESMKYLGSKYLGSE